MYNCVLCGRTDTVLVHEESDLYPVYLCSFCAEVGCIFACKECSLFYVERMKSKKNKEICKKCAGESLIIKPKKVRIKKKKPVK